MRTTIDTLVGRLSHDDGQTMVEYALASSVLVIVAVGAFLLLGPRVTSLFQGALDAFP